MTSADIWWDGRMWEGPGMIWAVLGMLASGLFWILLIAVVIKLIASRPLSIGSQPSGLRILEERYARGDITREEYLGRRAVLLGEAHPTDSVADTADP